MNRTWEKEKLSEICSLKTGKLNSNQSVENGEYPFFTCAPETFRINKFAFDTEAVLLAGNNAAGVYPLKYYKGKFNAYQRTYVLESLDDKKLDVRFLYYALIPVLGYFQSISIGASTQYLTKSVLDNFLLPLPKVETQKRIAEILSAYDDLIENNLKRIRLLEESARLLYREWFVRLKFPNHEHTPLIDGLPEGWSIVNLKDVCNINEKSLSGSFDGEIEYIDISCVTPNSINDTTFYDFKDAPSRARRIVKHGDIIWSCVRPNRKSHAFIWNPSENLIASTGFAVISPETLPTSYLYFAVTKDSFVGYLENRARGAAYPAVTAKDFEEAEIIKPSEKVISAFDEIINPMFSQTYTLRLQNQKLKQARDLLLPRLMSGEIAV